ncbi:hypothetical protein [Streptomyces sp. NPDC046978]|uniref:hypothetical protein n=1 Tax=Streptomyces sp. NPDC046978 TaxID=3154704 RepID=UPI0034089886
MNYESARWQDENYSQITWYGCSDDVDLSGNPDAFSAQIWEDISLEPDESYDNKTFTACFHGERSNGEWTDLPSGKKSYYFQIMDIHYSHDSAHWLNVTKYIQDTTKAD